MDDAALYRMAIEDDRYQVQLNWDRLKFFLVLNASILAAAVGLFRASAGWTGRSLVAILLGVGAVSALLGFRASRAGKLYHRSAILKKTLLERRLGLLEPVEGVSGDEAILALGSRARARRRRRGSWPTRTDT